MRKTFYVASFFAVVAALALSIISAKSPDWLVVKIDAPIISERTTIMYGLTERCQRHILKLPLPDGSETIAYTQWKCRHFPSHEEDACDSENKSFCISWTSAAYLSELGMGFAGMALVALMIGVSTGSRRRRVWRAVAAMVFVHAVLQLVAFGILTDLWRKGHFRHLGDAAPHAGYFLNTISWIFGFIIAGGIVVTGISADRGKAWAAGNRAYRPIDG